MKLTRNGTIQSHERVIVVSTANGLKFVDFKVGYHSNALEEVESVLANTIVELPGQYDSIIKAIESAV